MSDFEKLGVLYLGRPYDLATKSAKSGPLLYDSKDLVTHAVCVGMTGSGKTGLCIGLLEEAAIDNVPAIIIDPKGDIANLLLTFPDLQGSDFLPWINHDDAKKQSLTPEGFADEEAAKWKAGLKAWGQDGARIAKLREAADFLVYTPGSTAGLPVSILQSFAVPSPNILEDAELLGDRVGTTATSLLNLVGLDADPLQSPEHILLANVLKTSWEAGQDLTLSSLIQQIQTPPFSKLGVMDLESVFSSKDRFALAMRFNNLLGAPGFSAWLEGQPMDIDQILHSPAGKPRIAIFSIAHLNDTERMFFVSLLLTQMVSWMRSQSGTTSLRALLYMDEVFGFFPPIKNPPSKAPMLTMLKQARAFGLGVVLATQNPVDLDYKGLGNTGTWFIGRLQTERDMARVLDGLEGAAANSQGNFNRQKMEQIISGLGNRVFLMNNVHDDGPEIFETRWALSYLRGPLTRTQIKTLMDPVKAALSVSTASSASTKTLTTASQSLPGTPPKESTTHPPVLPPDIRQYFIPIRGARPAIGSLMYYPRLYGAASVHYQDAKRKLDEVREVQALVEITTGAVPVHWDQADPLDIPPADLNTHLSDGAQFGELPGAATQAKSYKEWEKDFEDWVYRTQTLDIFRNASLGVTSGPHESERDFRLRLQQLVRERRDDETDALRKKYAGKMTTLEDRIRRAEQAVQRESEQAKQQKLQTVISIGATLLSVFMGRKTVSRSSMGKATSAVRGMSRTMKEGKDVDRAEENVDALQQQLVASEAELQEEIQSLTAQWDVETIPLETLNVRPKKSNISTKLMCLAWVPYWAETNGQQTPAWR
ncbi:ATP-binding protein [Candidatus Nitrospira neomarina]|uniref:ATP-binding protein n=1 Tax=Candidatus Nitrospira neomarina TaxID=3020899 RepID=A0AA96GF11_9BACT|nr:ATP-binding protein [Candidatus Nitrospira neomarina]WNM60501.1 ATP-binding protein [Candidatus Nitrospira neomarina]